MPEVYRTQLGRMKIYIIKGPYSFVHNKEGIIPRNMDSEVPYLTITYAILNTASENVEYHLRVPSNHHNLTGTKN